MKTERPYCNAPWLGLFFEGTRGCAPCCEWKGEVFPGTITEYRKSDYLKDFKNLMYSDKMHPNCIECETNEKVNSAIGSTRKFYDSYDLESLCAGEEVCPDSNCNSPDGITKIVKLDFRAGNKCNMMCRMCGPQASSLIEEEAIKHGPIEYIETIGNKTTLKYVKDIDSSDVYDLDLSECNEVSILGGEPSIDLNVRKFMNHVADKFPGVKVMVTTNATNASKKWFETLAMFCSGKGLSVVLSVDAAGPILEYQRKSKIKWKTIKENMLNYKKVSVSHHNCYLNIQCTLTPINLITIDKWWDEFMNLDIDTHVNPVVYPTSMSLPAILPELKEESIKWLNNWLLQFSVKSEKEDIIIANKIRTTSNIIRLLKDTEFDIEALEKFQQQTRHLDKIRGENIIKLDDRFASMMDKK